MNLLFKKIVGNFLQYLEDKNDAKFDALMEPTMTNIWKKVSELGSEELVTQKYLLHNFRLSKATADY